MLVDPRTTCTLGCLFSLVSLGPSPSMPEGFDSDHAAFLFCPPPVASFCPVRCLSRFPGDMTSWLAWKQTIYKCKQTADIMYTYWHIKGTMLQKLSKCEVKAWLCCNLIILRYSDITWNPILVNSNGSKISFLAISEVLNFDFRQFEHFQVPNLPNFKVQSL